MRNISTQTSLKIPISTGSVKREYQKTYQGLERFLINHGLASIPLVPVSSSRAIVGAVIGIGILKGGRGIRWRTVSGIASGWFFTPVIAALLSFISLFFLQNVFQQNACIPPGSIRPDFRSHGKNTKRPGYRQAVLRIFSARSSLLRFGLTSHYPSECLSPQPQKKEMLYLKHRNSISLKQPALPLPE
ncbi:MAG: inorganic phosphate transporter [Deltaproteobacteria bacterium]|nr:inorganic phosphate transporter [Deltaproteobacteria bacterium]